MVNHPSEPDASAGRPPEGEPQPTAQAPPEPESPPRSDEHAAPAAAEAAGTPGGQHRTEMTDGEQTAPRPAVPPGGAHQPAGHAGWPAAPGAWAPAGRPAPPGWPAPGPQPEIPQHDGRTMYLGAGRHGAAGWYPPPGPPPSGFPSGVPGQLGGDPRWPGPGAHLLPAVRYPDAPAGNARGSRRGLLALGLVGMLIAGLIGGVVGTMLAQNGRNGSVGVLGQPLPGVEEGAAPTTPVEAVAARVLPSVVQLRVDTPGATGEGSAMVLSADGLLLTNNHVVEAAAQSGTVTAVFDDGRTAAALIVGRDPSSDVAVIRAQNVTGLVPVELGNSDSVRVGQQVVAFGAPLGLGGTVTTGIISAVDRAVNVGPETGANTPTVLNALQTDAAINPGNSGGPLVDMQGRVVGINSAIATTGAQGGSIGVGFSIPVNQARRVAEELERTGRASRAVLGVTVEDNPQQAGAIIREVVPGGAAEQAGIRPDDVVLRFGDQRISTGTDLQAAVGSRAPGEVVDVQLGDRTVQVTLIAAPN
ncbi:S1C family serine protease [Pseudonocardia sp. MH-G8]|uniref:S1C family serine protease n=1 Tax=Pseudonocardia sp. MH-G8 TaxID=1854588 RepID=UPI001E44B8FC|nr:trypsin-like peptidase domain-containing protein [Pseudonocardia sp. MH-G8]